MESNGKKFPNSGILSKIPPEKVMYDQTHRGSITVACPCGCNTVTEFWIHGKTKTGAYGPFLALKIKQKNPAPPQQPKPVAVPTADADDFI
jgi:hypothetical protein